jgi:hypothetical protein
MNSVDMANNLIFRAKHIQEFTVTTEIPDDFKFNGLIPFDMDIVGSILEAKVWAIDFDEAVKKLHEYLETCR